MNFRLLLQNKWVWLAVVLVLLALVMVAFWPVPQSSIAEVRLQPGNQNVDKAQTFTERVVVRSDKPANAIDVTLSYPADKLELVSTSTSKSRFDMAIFQPTIDKKAGTVRFVQATVAPFSGTTEEGYVGQMTFKAKVKGSVDFKVTTSKVVANDGNGTDLAIKKPDKRLWQVLFGK